MRLECDHFFARAQIKQNQCCTWKCHKMWRLCMWLCLPCKFSARTEAFRFCKQGLMGCSHVPWPPNKNKSHLSLWEFSFKKHYSCQWEIRGIRITFSFPVCQTLVKWPLNYLKWQEIWMDLKTCRWIMIKFTVQYHTLAMSLFQLFLYWGVPRISQETKTHLTFMATKLSGIVKSLKFHLWIVRRNMLVLNDDGYW